MGWDLGSCKCDYFEKIHDGFSLKINMIFQLGFEPPPPYICQGVPLAFMTEVRNGHKGQKNFVLAKKNSDVSVQVSGHYAINA